MEGQWNFRGGGGGGGWGGSQRPKFLKESMGWGDSNKKPSVGGVWIFYWNNTFAYLAHVLESVKYMHIW